MSKNMSNVMSKVEINVEYLEELMKRENLFQIELASCIGVSQAHINEIINKLCTPRASTVYKLAMFFDVPMKNFIKEI